ncbi:hypothetical protein [Micromonospora sp. DT62]|uniref:hypothetical protein n=1 Tax=Micromonospora sp. DT62 TaxID=3416521 RepID=UPI003CF476E5
MEARFLSAVAALGGDYLVSESLPAPMLPNVEHHITGRNTVTVQEYYLETLLAEMTVTEGGGERLAFVNKSFPHSRYDMMVLASSDVPHCAVTDMRRKTLDTVFALARRFVSFVSRPDVSARYGLDGGHFHLAFNFNRETIDRENSMFYDKRFHLHLNYWPARDVTPSPPRRLGEIRNAVLRRRLLDPISFLAPQVLHDKLGGKVGPLALLEPSAERDVAQQLPPGVKVRLAGWDQLDDGTLAQVLTELHTAADEAYREIFECVTGTPFRAEPWWRPTIRPLPAVSAALDGVSWLSPESRQGLLDLVRSLRNTTPDAIEAIKASERRQVGELAVASLDYSVSVLSASPRDLPLDQRSDIYLVVHFKLFSDIGGAGLTWLPGVPIVRVNRSSDNLLSAEEVAQRRAFQDDFLRSAGGELDEPALIAPDAFRDHR